VLQPNSEAVVPTAMSRRPSRRERVPVPCVPRARAALRPALARVLEDQPDYDHLPFRKKSLDEDRSAPVIFTVNFFAI
jgi:hypothetical protein